LREDPRFSAANSRSRTNVEGDCIIECPSNEVQIIEKALYVEAPLRRSMYALSCKSWEHSRSLMLGVCVNCVPLK